MDNIQTTISVTRDMNTQLRIMPLRHALIHGDEKGDRFEVNVVSGGQPVDLSSATIIGYFIRYDDSTVMLESKAEGNKAIVTLSEACYVVPGRCTLTVKAVLANGEKHALYVWEGTVFRSTTDEYIDPGHRIPDLEELLAQIERIEQDIAAANEATSKATASSEAADASAAKADTSAQAADEATARANASADSADAATELANAAAGSANTAADAANAAAGRVDAAIEAADDATADASQAAEEARAAASSANESKQAAQEAAEAAQTAADSANQAAEAATTAAGTANAAAEAAQSAAQEATTAKEAATEAASQATASAQQADESAQKADTSAQNAAAATEKANAAANEATTAAGTANEAAQAANDAAANVTDATNKANEAATKATEAAESATTAAQEAETAADYIGNITVSATDVAPGGQPTAEKSDVDGHLHITFGLVEGKEGKKGEQGAPNIVKGTAYDSLEALQAGVLDPAEGDQYNVGIEPPYNVYRWTGTSWEDQGKTIGPAGPAGKDGAPGKDGTTFTPSVDEDGLLSWTNDGDKANPDPVNIKGPEGASVTPKGPYAPETQYERLDLVTYEGSSYIATASVMDVAPGEGVEQWQLVAANPVTSVNGKTGEVNVGTVTKVWGAQPDDAGDAKPEIGGRNFLLQTNQGTTRWRYNSKDGSGTLSETSYYEKKGVKLTISERSTGWSVLGYVFKESNKLEPDTLYTASAIFVSDKDIKTLDVLCSTSQTTSVIATPNVSLNGPYNVNADIIANTPAKRYFVLKTKKDITDMSYGAIMLRFGNLQSIEAPLNLSIFDLKLEKGVVPTDWSPAPEDLLPDAVSIRLDEQDAALCELAAMIADMKGGGDI